MRQMRFFLFTTSYYAGTQGHLYTCAQCALDIFLLHSSTRPLPLFNLNRLLLSSRHLYVLFLCIYKVQGPQMRKTCNSLSGADLIHSMTNSSCIHSPAKDRTSFLMAEVFSTDAFLSNPTYISKSFKNYVAKYKQPKCRSTLTAGSSAFRLDSRPHAQLSPHFVH